MNWIERVCLMVVTACFGILLFEGALLLREARLKLDEVAGQYAGLVRPTEQAIAQVSAAGKTLAQIGAKERNDFDAQQAYYQKLTQDTDALLASMNRTVGNVNDVVLPKVGSDLDSLAGVSVRAGDDLDRVAKTLDGTVGAAEPLLVSVTEDAQDARPAIQNFAAMTAHGVGISASLEDISHRVDVAVGKALAPKNKFLAGLNAMAKGAITVAEFIFYVTH
jgi:hypothetical protein